jgi:putative two-component system response regulator
MRVLIVDDNEVTLAMLNAALLNAGFEVQSARNGREAMEIIRKHQHRLVVSDWEMPEMTGIELCKQVRAEDLPGYVYFILLTGHDTPQDIVEGLSAGADDFVTKPFRSPELIARVRTGERVLSLETREVAIFAMAKLAESRDVETGHHLERVRSYCKLLAEQLALSGRFSQQIDHEFVRLIYLTSPLHDIGKIGIPDSVLLKPGRLNDREFDIMKMHTTFGAQTLEAALRMFPGVKFLEMARDIAASHHERIDGSGYPLGLSGEQIPLCARIVALADVYDAISSKRVYKSAMSHEIAKSIILDESAGHFDPDVARAFLEIESAFIAVRDRLTEPFSAAA